MPRTRFSTRRGRPPVSRPSRDKGTPELCEKRAAGLTFEAIDTCYSRRLINEAQHRAALHFRWLYTLRFGAPCVQALDISRLHTGCISDQDETAWRQARQQDYREAAQLLEKEKLLVAVLRVSVFDDPTPLRADSVAASDCLHRLSEGLSLLVRLWHHSPYLPASKRRQTL